MPVLTDAGRDYLLRHAIDPLLLAQLGITERGGRLHLPNGRSTALNGGAKVLQPKGTPLAVWWPTGPPPAGGTVLVCEGESDALAALSTIGLSEMQNAGGPDDPLAGITVAAVPGTGYPAGRLAKDLRGAGAVVLAFDGDDAGRAANAKAVLALAEQGVAACALTVEDGRDLADLLAALEPRLRAPWLAGRIEDARRYSTLAKEFSGPLPGIAATSATPATSALLSQIRDVLSRYVVLPGAHEEVAVALFVLHTWAFAAAHATPYFVVQSPEKQSGKTRLLEVASVLVREPLQVASASEAALYRTIEMSRCTLLLDEVDAIFAQHTERTEALRGLLNSGNRSSGRAVRCVGQALEPKAFSTFCPKVLAGIDEGRLPDTITDRAIEIRMQRKLPGERVERFRERTAIEETRPLLEEIRTWAAGVEDRLAAAEPDLPDELSDRAAEAWEPLLAIAEDAGGDWPTHARDAAKALSGQPADDDAGSVQRRLLAGIRHVWTDEDRLSSADLCERLNADDELPYRAWSDGRGINPGSLAKYLKPYGIRSTTIRIADATPRGFKRDDFIEAWARYLPPDVAVLHHVAPVPANPWGVA